VRPFNLDGNTSTGLPFRYYFYGFMILFHEGIGINKLHEDGTFFQGYRLVFSLVDSLTLMAGVPRPISQVPIL
jgi:hypothetical protein